MMTIRRYPAAAATALIAALSFGIALHAATESDADLERDLARIRQATDAFHDLDAAREAGYPVSVPDCVESADGGMGYHHVHQALLDGRLEIERPEILVYAPSGDGRLQLAGVEYIVPYTAWTSQTPPRILGQPLKRSDELRIWYLHVWVWQENPKGMFADWNPTVKCPARAG